MCLFDLLFLHSYSVLPLDEEAELYQPDEQSEGELSDDADLGTDSLVSATEC